MAVESWVMILGSPRSGTTWTQLLLSQHPEVATCPETHLVDGYLAPLYDRVQWEEEHGMTGVSSLIGQEEVQRVITEFADAIQRRIADRAEDHPRIFLEKTPQHAKYPDLLRRHFPDARFLHVIRDPRDVVASLIAVNRTWGGAWAPPGPVEAAHMWVRHVRGARRLAESTEYRELYFEDLKWDTEKELRGLHEWLGLASDDDMRRDAVEACKLDRIRREPEQFDVLSERARRRPTLYFREPGTERRELGRSARRAVEQVAADEMRELGYEPGGRAWSGGSARVAASRFLQWVRDVVSYRLGRLASNL